MSRAGANYMGNNQCHFSVWAPEKESMILHIVHPSQKKILLKKEGNGYFSAEIAGIIPGTRYFYIPDNQRDFPDPASHSQPEGVHGPSEVIDHYSFEWHDDFWHGLPLKELIFYEIHVGTFTQQGTFEAIIPFLDDLVSTGINAIELMPVTQFPGERNWGYDSVYPYAVQNSYGGAEGLKKLIDECHLRSLCVYLDVIYNHLGIEGNYFENFGPWFSDRYSIPWGRALNFDGEWSDGVREYFSDNPVHWLENYHADGLRLDAVHMVYDSGAVNFWELMHKKIESHEIKTGKKFYFIAESDLNSPRIIQPTEMGGYNFDAQWLDDFHHALYVLLDKKGISRYEDFGYMEQLAKAYTDGFVHSGEYVKFRKRKHGASSAGISGEKFVAFNLNHDQVGNRVQGERLSVLVDFERLKLAAAALLLSPYIPLLFMGEEYGEDNPFYYFVNLSDEKLIKAVREGRRKEFENYKWESDPPDPQDPGTFNSSKIDWGKREISYYKVILEWHKILIHLRKTVFALQNMNKNYIHIYPTNQKGFMMQRRSEDEKLHFIALFNFSEEKLQFTLPGYSSEWSKIIDSKEDKWMFEKVGETLPERLKAGDILNISACSVAAYINSNNISH
jgi:maltooligosyltrehalose trehalohydrolase